jgi:hypothetical protein
VQRRRRHLEEGGVTLPEKKRAKKKEGPHRPTLARYKYGIIIIIIIIRKEGEGKKGKR